MPSGREGQMYAGAVKIVVHPMIPAAGKDADKVRGSMVVVCCRAGWSSTQSEDVIAFPATAPDHTQAADSGMA
jgi:hypothetical protein